MKTAKHFDLPYTELSMLKNTENLEYGEDATDSPSPDTSVKKKTEYSDYQIKKQSEQDQRIKMLSKSKNKRKKKKMFLDMSFPKIISNMKNVIMGILDDVLSLKKSGNNEISHIINIFTKNGRLVYVGLFIMMISVMIYFSDVVH